MRTCAMFVVMGVLVAGLSLGSVQAGVVTQTKTFSNTQTNSGTGVIAHAGAAGLSESFNPFNGALGTLDSYTVDWSTTISASGTTSSSGGNFNVQQGGTYYFGTSSYGGNGGGDGSSAGPNTFISSRTAVVTHTKTFLPSQAGQTYDPAILGLVTGSTPFSLKYMGSPNTIYATFTTMADITSTLTGSVTLTYNYTGAPVPEPASMWIGASLLAGTVGFRRFRKKA